MNDPRTDLLRLQMDSEHFRFRPTVALPEVKNYFKLTPKLSVMTSAPETALLRRAVGNFKQFCETSLSTSIVTAADAPTITFALESKRSFSTEEAFCIEVERERVQVTASHERGLLQATHYLEWLIAENGGPFLLVEKIERSPALSPRFSEGMFIPGMQSPHDLGTFSDEYLGLISHYGTNAFKIYLNLLECWKSDSLPELNCADFDAQIRPIRQHVQRLLEFGIDLYLQIVVPAIDDDHAVFKVHPEVKGSPLWIFLKELEDKKWSTLCSSSPLVLKAYQEVVAKIYQSIPELAGAVMIIGGECFFHCFTRPAVRGEKKTSCPHCQGLDPHREVPKLVNTVYRAMTSVDSKKRLMAWPYSSFVWSPDDSRQTKWIEGLDAGVELLSNFDCNQPDEKCGVNAYFWDYNIKLIGPSKVFAAQAEVCRKKGIRYHVKTETNTTPETFFLPYLPVHYRWFERFKAIRESGASGFMGQWRFYGMNASLPEALQYHSVWNPGREADQVLSKVVERDFGITGASSVEILAAWKEMSDSWDDFPHSAMTSGGIGAYMNGPWYLGPAHPLIFNTQEPYGLSKKFFLLRGDMAEMLSEEDLKKVGLQPRYAESLIIALPFGVKKYLEFTRRCRDRWNAGFQRLESAIGKNARPKATQELDVCRTIAIHLQSLVSTVEFFEARDRLNQEFISETSFHQVFDQLEAIARKEIANAEQIIPILQRDPRIGWGYTYGPVYDVEMVQEKIQQCQYVLQKELPRVRACIRFHVWNKDE